MYRIVSAYAVYHFVFVDEVAGQFVGPFILNLLYVEVYRVYPGVGPGV